MKFKGTKKYVSTEDLSMAVNASVTLERPLLIKGEPGTCLLYTSDAADE